MKKFNRKMKKLPVLLIVFLMLAVQYRLPVRADNEDYGTDAYAFLEYIDANLGYRVTNAETTPDITAKMNAGAWIKSTLESFGYGVNTYHWNHEGDEIYSYSCEKPGNSPMKLVIGAHYDSVDTKGVEDNGTGVSMVLELAKRFYNTETPLTLEFCFFDGEETSGFAGSYDYIMNQVDQATVLCYLNIDCIGAGDVMFAYGGAYEEEQLVRDWPYNMAMEIAYQEEIDLQSMPAEISRFRTPTRDDSSDHYYFNKQGIPYVYFEANRWVKPDGTLVDEEKPFMYNSSEEGFSKTNGQIIHTKDYEDLATIESIVPGRMRAHLTDYSRIISRMVREMSEKSAEDFGEAIVHPEEETPESIGESAETPAESEETESSTAIAVVIQDETTEVSEKETETQTGAEAVTQTGEETTIDVNVTETSENGIMDEGGMVKNRADRLTCILWGIAGLSAAVFLLSVVQIIRLRRKK